MEKQKFIEIGPIYYALAICSYFRGSITVGSEEDIKSKFYDTEEDYDFLEHKALFDQATHWLIEQGMLDVEWDDFGPPIYRMTNWASDQVERFERDGKSPFYKYALSGHSESWLQKALVNVNATFDSLKLQSNDFENPDEEWSPLPLDREDQNLKDAIKALDETIEQVRADNGYNATLAEERNYVLDGLSTASKTLKQAASTSAPYIQKYALEPLMMLIRRFKDAAISAAATAAKDALVEYLKNHGAQWIAALFK